LTGTTLQPRKKALISRQSKEMLAKELLVPTMVPQSDSFILDFYIQFLFQMAIELHLVVKNIQNWKFNLIRKHGSNKIMATHKRIMVPLS